MKPFLQFAYLDTRKWRSRFFPLWWCSILVWMADASSDREGYECYSKNRRKGFISCNEFTMGSELKRTSSLKLTITNEYQIGIFVGYPTKIIANDENCGKVNLWKTYKVLILICPHIIRTMQIPTYNYKPSQHFMWEGSTVRRDGYQAQELWWLPKTQV